MSQKISRRLFIAGLLGTMSAPNPASPRNLGDRPVVGAIRWDAWYDPADGKVARAAEAALSPNRYHYRMPFFGQETGPDQVRINGDSQEIMDREIDFAAEAGLDYWAFVSYAPENPMSNALKLYLESPRRKELGFCMIGNVANGSDRRHRSAQSSHEVRMFSEPGYLKVMGDRPLYYLLHTDDEQVEKEWGGWAGVAEFVSGFRSEAKASAGADPYIVYLDGNVGRAAEKARRTGCDAIGSYAIAQPRTNASFRTLVEDTESRWDAFARSGLETVPTVMTGWDQRPLLETPPFWMNEDQKGAGLDQFYAQATPAEIADELRDCIAWTRRNQKAVPTQAILVYAWNECAEGFGALVPTFRANDRSPDSSRLDAIRPILRLRP